eukprot:2602037-Prymnesium_polylepis.1
MTASRVLTAWPEASPADPSASAPSCRVRGACAPSPPWAPWPVEKGSEHGSVDSTGLTRRFNGFESNWVAVRVAWQRTWPIAPVAVGWP